MTSPDLGSILDHLRVLVAADSSDPVATMSPSHAAVAHCAHALQAAGCTVSMTDLGGGCINLLAVRGEPTILLNCHLDTVRPNADWSRDPFTLAVEDGKAIGLGACDIKGAAACMLAVAERTAGPLAILFSTDEEAGKGTCVNEFVRAHAGDWSAVVVAEPTGARAVTQHRGFASFELVFRGEAGHTSGDGASEASAIHRAVRWSAGALALAQPGGILDGSRFNIGIVEGGSASNVVAARSSLRFGFRPEPGPDAASRTAQRIAALKACLPATDGARHMHTWTDRFLAPPLTADARTARAIERWGVEAGDPVDFWTEAALFSAGGLPALVLGPGSIAQAHAADEFVALAQLESCAAAYARIVRTEAQNNHQRPAHARLAAEGTHAP